MTHSSSPHALVIPLPRQGHINPFMRLSMKLVDHGFTITFVHSHRNLRRLDDLLSSSSCGATPPCPSPGIKVVGISDGLPIEHPRTDIVELASCVLRFMPASLENLLEDLLYNKEEKVSCIISDFYMSFSMDVGKKFGIPSFIFFPQSSASLACHLLVSQESATSAQGIRDILNIPGVPPLQQSDVKFLIASSDPSSNVLFDFILRPTTRLPDSTIILLNTFEGLEPRTLHFLKKMPQLEHSLLLTIGPLQPSVDSDRECISLFMEDEECMSWLDTKPPASVLYISFGSSSVMSVTQAEEIAKGVGNSGVPFLWVLRPGLLTEDATNFPSSLDLPSGRFVTWAPQTRVLSHPSIGGFLTHCGWNSTLESIACGVPMLGWPYYGDQQLNNQCIAHGWHLGLSMEKNTHGIASKEEVEKKVRILMSHSEGEGKIIWERTQHLKEDARSCTLEGGSSQENFSILLKKLLDLCQME